MNIPSPRNSNRSGFTILEVLIAAFFLALTTVMATQLLATAERLRGRGRAVAYAEIIASGDIERVRSQSDRLVIPGDTLYDETMNGMAFGVMRKLLPRTSTISTKDTVERSAEYALAITKKATGDTLVRLRFLQGREK